MLEHPIFTVVEEEEDVLRPPTQPPTRIIISLSFPSLPGAVALTRSEFRRWMSGVRADYESGKEVILRGTFESKASWFKCPFLFLQQQAIDTTCHVVARCEYPSRGHFFCPITYESIT